MLWILWVLGAVMLAVWIIGLALKVTTGLIHLALIAAVILFIFGFIRGRTAGARSI